MSISEMSELLTKTMWKRCSVCIIILIICFITLTIRLVIRKTTGSNEGVGLWSLIPGLNKQKSRYSLKYQIGLDIVCIILVTGFLIWQGYPMYKDIQNEQYEEVYTEYSRTYQDSKKSFVSNGTVHIRIDGKLVSMELPTGWTKEDFPEGEFTGTVRYAKDSKVILSFEVKN